MFSCFIIASAQTGKNIISVSASVNAKTAGAAFDNNPKTEWNLSAQDLQTDQWLIFTLNETKDINGLELNVEGTSKQELKEALAIYVTYDPMNWGGPADLSVNGSDKKCTLSFESKYGVHVKITFKGNKLKRPLSINEIKVNYPEMAQINVNQQQLGNKRYLNSDLPVEERVESLLAIMTPEDKMELLREGWGIPGIPHLKVPNIMKVEAVHGFSHGSGATIFPQAIAMGATWNKDLTEKVATVIGKETVIAGTKQAWSPVLDVAQDARWGRCEETYGEDPVLVSQIGGAWIKGYQSQNLFTTPKHFGGHGATLGGRDSHDIGLSEREMREIHLVPFRHVIKNYDCQSIMMAYSDYLGIPVAKSTELLQDILRDEWGFSGFIVSDCGAISNLTAKKHYTATDKIEAAKQALAAGIATNCGDTYNDKTVIEAAKNGQLNMEDLDNVCRTMLRTMFRNELFENNPSKPLDWNKVYPGWNTPEHKELAREAARQSIVLLENKGDILPLSKSVKTIAVIGPGADNLQPGDYTAKLQPGQLKSVLTGIKDAVGKNTKVLYERGCDFFTPENYDLDKALAVAKQSDVVVMVLGDCSTSEHGPGIKNTSGENNDYASLILPGGQQKLLKAVCDAGKPVILILQAGRPFNLRYAAEHCKAILVNWLPGQEGGYATADVLFGDYNPAGRLPMTFPQDVAQLPLYYNFKTSGRRYEYVDMPFYPLYRFGYGLSYSTFEYSGLTTQVRDNGNINVSLKVINTGTKPGDEVVQLYVTDMYASVKTRVTELKDFARVNLKPNESKTVSFTITPYELSLLNDQMDRVVEKGEFKIMVGGVSPSYLADDKIKDSVGYKESKNGVVTTVNYPKEFAANFEVEVVKVEENLTTNKKTAVVRVRNTGNLTDTGKVTMYIDGKKDGNVKHFELDPGREKQISFPISKTEYKNLLFTTKYKSVTQDS